MELIKKNYKCRCGFTTTDHKLIFEHYSFCRMEPKTSECKGWQPRPGRYGYYALAWAII